jgi:hypothetical protein
MSIKYTNIFPLQDSPKITQIRIFGLKLATLVMISTFFIRGCSAIQ